MASLWLCDVRWHLRFDWWSICRDYDCAPQALDEHIVPPSAFAIMLMAMLCSPGQEALFGFRPHDEVKQS